ncbi:sigma factor [Amycolatopsis sp. lyj-23]|uniref:sigma factor n=1 Tax=Amycolatopsis sp. lyj-23 TaxID=2789283 RepID=UPI00397CA59A
MSANDRSTTTSSSRSSYSRLRSTTRWSYSGTRSRDSDADDCAQEVLLGALPDYHYGAAQFMSFVYGVASHKVIDAHRRRESDTSHPVSQFALLISDRPGPLRQVERLELCRRIGFLLTLLGPEQRDVVVLRVMVGLSARKTAATLGVASSGAVRVSRHRPHHVAPASCRTDPVTRSPGNGVAFRTPSAKAALPSRSWPGG